MIHQNGLHLDIKPQNILMDLAAISAAGFGPNSLPYRTYSNQQSLTNGFARSNNIRTTAPWPVERYLRHRRDRTHVPRRRPPSARFALNATPYSRLALSAISQDLLQAIDLAMILDPAQRPQSIEEFSAPRRKPLNPEHESSRSAPATSSPFRSGYSTSYRQNFVSLQSCSSTRWHNVCAFLQEKLRNIH